MMSESMVLFEIKKLFHQIFYICNYLFYVPHKRKNNKPI